jgi:6-phosphogluconolactonase
MTTRPLAAALAVFLLAGFGSVTAMRADASAKNPIVGGVYTATNATDLNQVVAYSRTADGTLEFLGEYATGGRGSGGAIDPLQSQNSIIVDPTDTYLFVANSGSGDITEFLIQAHGRLRWVGKVPSGGGFPNSLAFSNNFLYVLNAGGAGNITGFQLYNGQLVPIPGATHLLTAASAGGASIVFSADGQTLAVTERLTNNIDLFSIAPNGSIAGETINTSSGNTPFAVVSVPQGAFVVAEAAGNPAGGSAISSYTASGGKLSTVTASLPTGYDAACWLATTSDGQYAFIDNAGSGEVSIAGIDSSGNLSILGAEPTGAGTAPLDINVSKDNKFVYALTAGAGTISGFAIGVGGALIPLPATPAIPAASGQNGLAVY